MYIFITLMMCYYICPALLIKAAGSATEHTPTSHQTILPGAYPFFKSTSTGGELAGLSRIL